jgi:hypothetical protein
MSLLKQKGDIPNGTTQRWVCPTSNNKWMNTYNINKLMKHQQQWANKTSPLVNGYYTTNIGYIICSDSF